MGRNGKIPILLPEAPPSAFVLKIRIVCSRPCSYERWVEFSVFPGQCGFGGFQTKGKSVSHDPESGMDGSGLLFIKYLFRCDRNLYSAGLS